MPQNTNDWNNFLNNGKNKTDLINFFLRYFSPQRVVSRFKVKLLYSEYRNTSEIMPSGINMLFTCNHHETDTSIVLIASRSIKSVIVTVADTDVLVVLTHAYPQCNNAKQWLMKINPAIFIDIKTIYNFFGRGIFQILPGFDSIIGCDRTSYPFGLGKISPFKKMRHQNVSVARCGKKQWLISNVRQTKVIFRGSFIFSQRKETFASTMKRLYENQKYKSSSQLIPGTHSKDKHWRRGRFTNIYLETVHGGYNVGREKHLKRG